MLKIDILKNEDLQGTVKKFISALLPHPEYKSADFLPALHLLLKYVHLDEFEMEYYLILRALSQMGKIKAVHSGFVPELTQGIFEGLLEAQIDGIVDKPELGVVEWLEWEGMDTNLQNEVVREDACQKVCQRCVDLYEECFALAIGTDKIANYEPELKAAFERCVCVQNINTQVEIVRGKTRIGRRWYSGFDDWKLYSFQSLVEISNRLSDVSEEQTLALDSFESSARILAELKESYEPIADWGIPELDNYTPILKHRYVVVVANENVGKTHFAVDKTVNVILAGGKVVYMCGESTKATIYQMVLRNYVWKKYGVMLEVEHLLAPEDCPKDIERIIKMSVLEVVQKCHLILQDAFSYKTVGTELESLYSEYKFDVVVIDHSFALKGTIGDGSLQAKGSALSGQLLAFKRAHPVTVLLTSHMSVRAKDLSERGKNVTTSSTKGSSDFGNDADEVFQLETDTMLKKQALLKLIVLKRRGPAVQDPIMLVTKFEVSALIYDKSKQAADEQLSLKKAEALAAIASDLDEAEYTL